MSCCQTNGAAQSFPSLPNGAPNLTCNLKRIRDNRQIVHQVKSNIREHTQAVIENKQWCLHLAFSFGPLCRPFKNTLSVTPGKY